MSTTTIASFQGFLEVVTKLQGGNWIFRGQPESEWPLLPSVDRKSVRDIPCRLLEESLLQEFKRKARPFLTQLPLDEWEWLALAQHHGLPTRLLDWTDNPLVALFFAVENITKPESSAVWCYQPSGHQDIGKSPFDIEYIVVYQPPCISNRIAPQSGLFSCHPVPVKSVKSGEEDEGNMWPGTLLRLVIPGWIRQDAKVALSQLGVHSASLFPGLDGITEYLCTTWSPGENGVRSYSSACKYGRRWAERLTDGQVGKVLSLKLSDQGIIDTLSIVWINSLADALNDDPFHREEILSVPSVEVRFVDGSVILKRFEPPSDADRADS